MEDEVEYVVFKGGAFITRQVTDYAEEGPVVSVEVVPSLDQQTPLALKNLAQEQRDSLALPLPARPKEPRG